MNYIITTFDHIPISDWYSSFYAVLMIIFCLVSVEIGVTYFNFGVLYTRKFIHISTGLIVCFISFFLHTNLPIILFAGLYILLDLWALRKGKFKSIHPDSKSFGTIFYAISVIILAIWFWDKNKPLFIITNLIMIIPDAMAAIIGERHAKTYFIPVSEKKSLIGASAMFISTIFIVFVSLQYFYNYSLEISIIIALIISTIATSAELLSIKGSDNLSVPLFSGLFLHSLLSVETSNTIRIVATSILCAAAVAVLSYRFRFLNAGGSILAFLMGTIIFGFGGWAYSLPILGFFTFSSILTKIGKTKKRGVMLSYQKSGPRDFYQALANGGVATIIVLIASFYKIDSLFYVYIAAIGAATADTWGTELGIFSKGKPFLITNLKRVLPGTSGAISFLGSVSALLGSFVIVLIGHMFYYFSLNQIILVSLIGFSGSLFDSLLGATIQGQFECKICHTVTESKSHCGTNTTLLRGIYLIDNDIVNIFSILFSSSIAFIIY